MTTNKNTTKQKQKERKEKKIIIKRRGESENEYTRSSIVVEVASQQALSLMSSARQCPTINHSRQDRPS